MKNLILAALLFLSSPLIAGAASKLPTEREMQVFVDEVLAMTGLHNEVDVVIDPAAKGCAYAPTIEGKQAIGVDPGCVGPLRDKKKTYNWRTIGVLAHEIGHLLSGHTTNQKNSNPVEESAADEFSGWAMFRLGATLNQAQTCAASMSVKGSDTHPPRAVRLESVARGWNNAKTGKMPAQPKTLPERWSDLMKEKLPWVK